MLSGGKKVTPHARRRKREPIEPENREDETKRIPRDAAAEWSGGRHGERNEPDAGSRGAELFVEGHCPAAKWRIIPANGCTMQRRSAVESKGWQGDPGRVERGAGEAAFSRSTLPTRRP
mgnify:CR=1 FL=1